MLRVEMQVEMMMLCPTFACATEIECLMVIFQRFGTPDEEVWPGMNIQYSRMLTYAHVC
jgi:hypothetical protein